MMKEVKKSAPRGSYIPMMLEQHCLNGDAFVMAEEAYMICTGGKRSYQMFQADLAEQIKLGKIHREGQRLYLPKICRYENRVADHLADILYDNAVPSIQTSDELGRIGTLELNGEQCEAVRMALSHRLSVILGGAGTGKSTLVQKIVDEYPFSDYVLAAPTGKAARNLAERTGLLVRTVHSVLGLRPDDEALSPVVWEYTGLVVIDEASMMTLELLTGLLEKAQKNCRIVLVGDHNQLSSVGSGNVIQDLLELGIPCVQLQQNFRQTEQETALYHNVVGFNSFQMEEELRYDASFRLEQADMATATQMLVEEAVSRFRAGEDVQVLSPFNEKTQLSVKALNRALQERLNPEAPNKPELEMGGECFREGDRVIIIQNDYQRNCVNGDIGIFHIDEVDGECPFYHVELPDGRMPQWMGWGGLMQITLAYALTVHKAQGSQYDTVLFPVAEQFSGMLYRNLLYTAISRAKRRVILYGSRSALNGAMQTMAKARRSMLVVKTNMAMMKNIA